MGDLRKQLAEAIALAEPDTDAVEKLTQEIRSTDSLIMAQKLLAPEPKETPGAPTARPPRNGNLRNSGAGCHSGRTWPQPWPMRR